MSRTLWLTIGFLSGVLTSVISALAVYFWLFSPVRIVEKVLGWNLPGDVSLTWQQDERDGFFGQGKTLSVFTIASDFSQKILAKCPPGLKFGTFEQSGIQINNAWIDRGAPSCFLRKDEPNRGDIIVISKDRLFHLRIDR